MLPGRSFSPDLIVRIVVRRKWLIALPFGLGLAIAPVIAQHVPKLYQSETLIMVVPQRVPDSYVKSTVTVGVEDRLPSISDHILSRSRLERIILDFDLYREERQRGVMEDVVARMRRDISVPPLGAKEKESFRVSYVNADPQVAQKVTARLASLYIEENLRDRGNLADSTSAFIESELQEAKRRLIEHETKLEEYRRRHAGELPTQLESNLQVIQNAQLQLQANTDAANRARERRLLFERQKADAEMLPVATAAPIIPGAPEAVVLPLAQQLEAAQARLEQLKLRYTAEWPEVRSQERVVRELVARVAEEQRASKTDAPKPAAPPPPSAAELARQKRIRDVQAELDVIDHQLASFQAEEQRLKEKIREYQAKVDAVPSRESELVELTRDYSTLQAQYQSLATKREDSKLAANLERRQIGEQFRILDPASLPERPFNQRDRMIFIFAGAVVGLLLGVAMTGLLEFRDSTFREEADISRALNLSVLALVPVIATDGERRSQRLRHFAVECGAALVLIACVAVLVLWRGQL